MKRWHIVLIIALLLTMAAGGTSWWYVQSRALAPGQLTELGSQAQGAWQHVAGQLNRRPSALERSGVSASGFIEAREISVMSEVPGQIVDLTKDEGDQVQAGELLIQLDEALLEARLAEAEAVVALAEAGLARAEAGLPPAEIARLEALVAKAQVARDWAKMAWQDAIAIRQNPQDLAVEIAESHARVQALDHQLKQALAMKDAAEIAKNELSRTVTWLSGGFDVDIPVPGGGTISKHIEVSGDKISNAQDELDAATTQWWQAWVGVNTAATSKEWAQAALSDLLAVKDNPQELQAQVDTAWAQYEQAEAALSVAQAQLALAKAGASEQDLAVAEAQVAQARSAYDVVAAQRDKRRLQAPVSGRVIERLAQERETIGPGTPLLTLANLGRVTLTLYIPEADIGRVTVGQPVSVTVDSYPHREFVGEVVHIATEAEFTPRNIQTREERVGMVFAVKVELPNPDAALKPGMPADAVLGGRS